jgi:SWI/SNF-related matrix-associated actin-dependent regulator of chromatin subfamily B protein 1
VSVVPLAGSDKAIPALSESEIKDIQAWRQTDRDYEGIWRKMKERMTEEIRTVTGPSKAAWWEKDAVDLTRRRPREPFDVRYPRQKRGDGRERRKTGRREGLRLPRKLKAEDANRPEQLVPIRLEFDVEHHKMRDSFVWNLNDPVVTPEAFAQSVVEDYGLAPNYHTIITESIQDQLSDFRIHSLNPDGDFNEADADLVRCDWTRRMQHGGSRGGSDCEPRVDSSSRPEEQMVRVISGSWR